jgi:hypothetical protein
MGDEVLVTVGLDAAKADLAKWTTVLATALAKRSLSFAQSLAPNVTSKEPVLTGTLARSVKAVALPGTEGAGVELGEGVVYAGWIEFGGSRGRPFIPEGRTLWPTVKESESDYRSAIEDETERTIETFPWSKPSG